MNIHELNQLADVLCHIGLAACSWGLAILIFSLIIGFSVTVIIDLAKKKKE